MSFSPLSFLPFTTVLIFAVGPWLQLEHFFSLQWFRGAWACYIRLHFILPFSLPIVLVFFPCPWWPPALDWRPLLCRSFHKAGHSSQCKILAQPITVSPPGDLLPLCSFLLSSGFMVQIPWGPQIQVLARTASTSILEDPCEISQWSLGPVPMRGYRWPWDIYFMKYNAYITALHSCHQDLTL